MSHFLRILILLLEVILSPNCCNACLKDFSEPSHICHYQLTIDMMVGEIAIDGWWVLPWYQVGQRGEKAGDYGCYGKVWLHYGLVWYGVVWYGLVTI